MRSSLRYFFLLFCFLFSGIASRAQNITGTWEGIMNDEFLQINVEQRGNELCGYTYDILLDNRTSYCRAYFTGYYDKASGVWTINGVSFIQNSGNHVLMTLRLWQKYKNNPKILKGLVTTRSMFSDYFGFEEGDSFEVSKVSSKPRKPFGKMPVCYPGTEPEPKKPEVKKPVPVKPKPPVVKPPATPKPPVTKPKPVTPKPPVVKPKPPVVKPKPPVTKPVPTKPVIANDTLKQKPVIPQPVKVKPPVTDRGLIEKMTARRKTEVSRLAVDVKHIELKVYDNGVVDNDTVSIFYNGRLLKGKQRLSEKPLIIEVDLDDNTSIHEITMFAENLGGIPPNTAIIVVTAGDKRYELRSSASLEENAVLVFEYKPK